MKIVGLTGGIASGKSTVSRWLAEAGAHIIDADLLAREVVAPGQPAFAAVVDHFGSGILKNDGTIDRDRLAAEVFADPKQKAVLERIIHPAVAEAMAARLAQIKATAPESIVVLDVPLLFEAGMDAGLDLVVMVDAPNVVQLHRLMKRNNLSRTEALARIGAQMPMAEKRRRADVVIDNSGSLASTRTQVEALWQRLTSS
ncbi:MAG: dephospho-CoA kinase [Desulfobacterales bacterium]|jgi:dephospho-CoA kinase|nr:dephospho-CoA kinase [Desulfobacteraceae bacterium]MDY0312033.1 dephospho-CoA kinase [Desulfobacterales bacterium]